jgi:phosphocarrier protein HPr
MVERDMTIVNKLGLHARAAAKLVNLAGQFSATLKLQCNGKDANAKSIMSVMMLAAVKGTTVHVIADGDDSLEAVDAIEALMSARFGEPE